MAFFNDLVRAIATAEGIDEMTVAGIGQYLREAGFISKGGRGRSAARMTPLDAAHMLIAVNGSDLAKDAATSVIGYGQLSPVPFRRDQLAPVSKVFGDLKFSDALANLIKHILPDDDGISPMSKILSSRSSEHVAKSYGLEQAFRSSIRIEVGFRRPYRMAYIRIHNREIPSPPQYMFERLRREPIFMNVYGPQGEYVGADRSVLTTISTHTLRSVGESLVN